MNAIRETFLKRIGARLKAVRLAFGYKTLADAAESYQIPRTTYSQYESGKRAISLATLHDIADKLSIEASWLLTGKGPFSKTHDYSIRGPVFDELRKNEMIDEEDLQIESDISTIDVDLLRQVVTRIITTSNNLSQKISAEELFDLSINIYNNIVVISDYPSRKSQMIDLAVSSIALSAGPIESCNKEENSHSHYMKRNK